MSSRDKTVPIVSMGSPMSERECFAMFVDSMGNARDAARGIAHSRKEIRWLAVSKILDETLENAKRLMHGGTGLILPPKH